MITYKKIRILNKSNLDIIFYNVCSTSFSIKGKRNGSTERRENCKKVNMSNQVEHQDVTLRTRYGIGSISVMKIPLIM